MSSDEEVDYMSDAFLESLSGKEDIRPGLLKSHAQRYDHSKAVKRIKTEEINRIRNPSMKEKELASREAALNKPLDSDNVGFKMMQKLGFKAGSGLGKQGEGRVEPIGVEVKTDRQGLGRQASLREVAQLRAKFRSQVRDQLLNVDDYRQRKAGEAAERQATTDLMKSQRVCWELDSQEYVEEPAESWFWPESKLPKVDEDDNEEEEDNEQEDSMSSSGRLGEEAPLDEDVDNRNVNDDDFSVQEKLEMLTLYLRRTYQYCVWCGHRYDDEKDFQEECPGPTRSDH